MRRLLIALACVVVASPACWARCCDRWDFARPGTNAVQFQQDRDDCIVKTKIAYRRRSAAPPLTTRLFADHKNYCQNNPNPSPPPPGYQPPMNYYHPPTIPRDENYRGWTHGAPMPEYGLGDDLFLQCMRDKGYRRVPESTGFSVGPLWK